MRMLVTGAGGMVGSYVPEVFGSKYDLELTDLDNLDVRQRFESDADVVLHLAALTDVDECEVYPERAYLTNAVGTYRAAKAAKHQFVYVSTAGVFFGDQRVPYDEHAKARPANIYGLTKLEGEHLTSYARTGSLVVRAGWMFGGKHLDKKFVGKIANQVSNGAEHVRAVRDKFGSPTYAKDLLHAIDRLLDAGECGTFHCANQGVASRFRVAQEVVTLLGADVEVVPVESSEFPLPAPRADSEAMVSLKMKLIGMKPPRPWQEALAEYLAA